MDLPLILGVIGLFTFTLLLIFLRGILWQRTQDKKSVIQASVPATPIEPKLPISMSPEDFSIRGVHTIYNSKIWLEALPKIIQLFHILGGYHKDWTYRVDEDKSQGDYTFSIASIWCTNDGSCSLDIHDRHLGLLLHIEGNVYNYDRYTLKYADLYNLERLAESLDTLTHYIKGNVCLVKFETLFVILNNFINHLRGEVSPPEDRLEERGPDTETIVTRYSSIEVD